VNCCNQDLVYYVSVVRLTAREPLSPTGGIVL